MNRSFMMTDGEWKYIWYEVLFHILEDPNEVSNLAHKNLEKRLEYRNKLIDILAAHEQDPLTKT
ncbi:hypothetical protein J2S74_004514 [Evansella vedderi]|uniref:Uncharacterized protein n=1 Tax=Evansella vedderi TaxID=38282 RepID=A0ABU0A0R0_9BACI|nr:hypothetical protein [Evansella vedderi]